MTVRTGSLDNVIAAAVRRDRDKRSDRRAEVFGRVLGQLVATALAGFSLMIAVGVVHAEWIRNCPTVGYWDALIVAALLRSALLIPTTPPRRNT